MLSWLAYSSIEITILSLYSLSLPSTDIGGDGFEFWWITSWRRSPHTCPEAHSSRFKGDWDSRDQSKTGYIWVSDALFVRVHLCYARSTGAAHFRQFWDRVDVCLLRRWCLRCLVTFFDLTSTCPNINWNSRWFRSYDHWDKPSIMTSNDHLYFTRRM